MGTARPQEAHTERIISFILMQFCGELLSHATQLRIADEESEAHRQDVTGTRWLSWTQVELEFENEDQAGSTGLKGKRSKLIRAVWGCRAERGSDVGVEFPVQELW